MKITTHKSAFWSIRTTPTLCVFLFFFLLHSNVFANESYWMVKSSSDDWRILLSNDCENVTDGGEIAGDETGCNDPVFDPAPITNLTLPSGGTGELEYIWVSTTDDPSSPFVVWNPIPGSTESFYDPGPITQTTYFRRCARRSGCVDYIGESNVVVKEINCCDNITDGGLILEDQEGCEPSYDPSTLTSLVLPSGGTGAIEYLWFTSTVGPPFLPNSPDWVEIPEANSPEYDPLPVSQTTYFIRCSRREGCTTYTGESNIITITLFPNPSIEITAMASPSCFGVNDGNIQLQASGGTLPYNYTWSNNAGNVPNNENLSAGTYSVTVQDSKGCTATTNIILTDPEELIVETTTSNAECDGNNSASATANVSGGIPPYTYLWNDDNAQTTSTATNLSAGNYFVLVTDANGCTETAEVIIENNNALNVEIETTDVVCAGDNNGEATATVTGGTSPYTYLWSNGQETVTATGLSAGNYSFTVTDANGCSIEENISINESSELSIEAHGEDVSCFGDNDGIGHTTVMGGTPPFSYQWNDAAVQTSATATNLTAGNYTVMVTDANGCTDQTTLTIGNPNEIVVMITSTDANCGENDGTATATISGGTAPFSYLWSDLNGQTTETATNLGIGNYSVTVTDANGCTATGSGSISEFVDFGIMISSTSPICSDSDDGNISATPSNGTAPFSYSWNDANNQTTATAIDLEAGTYTVTVTDANGCSDLATTTLTAPDDIEVTVNITDIDCAMGTMGEATVSVSGGVAPYTYLWNDANNQTTATATNLAPGSYEVIVADANACKTVRTVLIQSVNGLQLSITSNDLSCPNTDDGSAEVTVMQGMMPYTYLWSTGADTPAITGLPAGTYTVTVTDANGCSNVANTTVNQPDGLMISTSSTEADCMSGIMGTATATASGGVAPYTYLWDDANGQTTATAIDLGVGTYTVTVTDANGCSNTANVLIEGGENFTLSIQTFDALCNGGNDGSALVSVNGGTAPFTYQWNDANSQTGMQAFGLTAGSYSVTVTDANACMTAALVNIGEPEDLVVMVSKTDIDCAMGTMGSATATVSGGTAPYFYVWNDADNQTTATATELPAGNYEVTVTDDNGCMSIENITIQSVNGLDLTVSSVHLSCFDSVDGSLSVTVTQGMMPFIYLWNTGEDTPEITDLSAGTYTVTVTDANGCSNAETVTLTAPDALEITISATDVDCMGGFMGSATAIVSGGSAPYSYLWDDPNAQTTASAINLSNGTYTVTVTDVNGCVAMATTEIITESGLGLDIQTFDVLCVGGSDGSALANVNGGTAPFTYQWDDSANQTGMQAFGLVAGTYSVTVTDANGCSVNTSATVNEPEALQISISKSDLDCSNGMMGTATATVSGGTTPYFYAWNDTNNQTTATATNLSAGNYEVTVTDDNGCSTTANVTIEILNSFDINVSSNDVSCGGGNDGTASVTTLGGLAPFTYLWDNGEMAANITGLSAGTYAVTVTDANGCTAEGNTTVSEPPLIQLTVSKTDVNCPNTLGSATVTANGGSGFYTYQWNDANNQTTPTASDLISGSYTVFVTDENGCSNSANVTIETTGNIDVEISPSTAEVCAGNSVFLSATPSGSEYTYSWSATGGSLSNPTANGTNYTMMMPGTYTITVIVTNEVGCQGQASVDVTVHPEPDIEITPSHSSTCNDANVTFGVTPELPGFGFNWTVLGGSFDNPNSANPTFMTNTPGTYTISVTATSAMGCSTSASTTITISDTPTCSAGITQVISSRNGSDGAVAVNVFNGTSPYTYLWNTGSTDFEMDGLSAGTYTVTVTDANGCTCEDVVTLINPAKLGDFVWEDSNQDGLQNFNEPGIEGVEVVLSGTDVNGNSVTAGTMTDANGMYMFDGLQPGTYKVTFETPDGFLPTADNIGDDEALDSDANPITGMTNTVDLEAGDYNQDLDAGYFESTVNIGDYVWNDVDRDGIQDGNELGIAGVLVVLIDLGPDQVYGTGDDAIAMGTTTNAIGRYLFTNVPPGKYVIEFNPLSIPNGFVFTTDNQGGDDELDSDPDPDTGVTPMFMVVEDQEDDLSFDAGVYAKCNNITDAGEIQGDEVLCGSGSDPALITNVETPSGGAGPIEYLWMRSTVGGTPNGVNDPNWEVIPSATEAEYDPPIIFTTTYFARCARRECCTNYFETNIVTKRIGQVPIAAFEEAPASACVNQSVSFTATFGGATASYHWDFGEGATPATAEGRIVSDVRWTTAGAKTIILTTQIEDCINEATTTTNVTNCLMNLGQFDVFEGQAMLDESYIDLNWSTLEEPYQSFFVVERADATASRYNSLEVMPAYGGTERQSYNFKDTQPKVGYNHYRIKHFDAFGDYLYSETIRVLWRPTSIKDIVIHPNPFRDKTYISVVENLEEDGQIQLVSPYGQLLKIMDLPANAHDMELDLSAYPKGIYFLYIRYNGHRKMSYRVVKADDN